MELMDMNHKEKVACLALVHAVVTADHATSPEEAEHIAILADEFGEAAYIALVEEANELVQTEEDLKAVVHDIIDQDTRELVFETILECAIENGVVTAESELLEWLAEEWDIEIVFQDDETEVWDDGVEPDDGEDMAEDDD